MKKLILLGISCVMLHTVSYAQDAPAQDRHKLGLIMEGNSGTLVKDTDGFFAGNELTIALDYGYSFANAPWLTLFTRLGFIGNMNFNNINLHTTGPDQLPGNEGNVDPLYKYNGFSSSSVGVDYFETGLVFGDYGSFSVRARNGVGHNTGADAGMLIKMYGYYPLIVGDIHMIKFSAGLEVNPLPVGSKLDPGDPSLEAEGTQLGTAIDLLTFGMMYQVQFNPAWSVSTGLHLRTSGHKYKLANSATGDIWEADTAEAFRNNLHLRWENTVTYMYNDSFSIWGQVRYQPERIAIAEQSDSIYELTTQHEVFLRFGMNYFFNF